MLAPLPFPAASELSAGGGRIVDHGSLRHQTSITAITSEVIRRGLCTLRGRGRTENVGLQDFRANHVGLETETSDN